MIIFLQIYKCFQSSQTARIISIKKKKRINEEKLLQCSVW